MVKQVIKITALVGMSSYLCLTTATEMVGEYYEVHTHEVSPPVSVSGTVIPKKEVTLSAQLPGRVELIAGEEGDAFSESTVLVALDDRELLAQRRAAIADWRNAQATLRNAGIQYSREYRSPDSPEKAPGGMGLPHLFDQFVTKPLSDLLSESDDSLDRNANLYRYGTQVEQAQGTLMQAQSRIEQIDAKLRDAESQAPFDGVITKKLVEVGDTVQPGQPLLQFADIEHLQLEVDVPARLVSALKVGKTVTAKLDVLSKRVNVTVARIFPVADRQRHTVKVKLDLSLDTDEQKYISPGQYAQIDIPDIKAAGQQKLLLVPTAAVDQGSSLPSICVAKGNNQYETRLVRLGQTMSSSQVGEINPRFREHEFISILSGLKEGDQIVVTDSSKPTPCVTQH
ncbi:RND family efflux transporter MFP subunit [Thioploca ingrica]|uniref:RND family efflux transporter MFP subunit n=1 Tax=Thioploca ingrica TaxID=40754 RepID=A0A090ABY7_9GAMM|nr:RND family efflux transporter MFP subunit [Thioploca ingrica]